MKLAFGLKGKRPAAAAAVAAFGVDDDDEASEVDGATKRPKTDGVPPPLPQPPASESERSVAEKLAQFVAKNGDQFEDLTRQKNPPDRDTAFRWLHDRRGATFLWYRHRVEEARRQAAAEAAEVQQREERAKAAAAAAAAAVSAAAARGAAAASQRPRSRFTEDPGVLAAAAAAVGPPAGGSASAAEAAEEGTASAALSERAESLRKMEEYVRAAAAAEAARKAADVARAEAAERLGEDVRVKPDGSRGHHMDHFIPPDELQRFMAASAGQAAPAGGGPHAQIGEDNPGFRMLKGMGWREGQGLGAGAGGITAPVQANAAGQHGLGVGANAAVEVAPGDDIFEQYKKRMQLGYKHRPNPLGNPRKSYY